MFHYRLSLHNPGSVLSIGLEVEEVHESDSLVPVCAEIQTRPLVSSLASLHRNQGPCNDSSM